MKETSYRDFGRVLKFNIMENSRFETLKVSKFNTLSNEELEEVMGGLCISCKKRERAVEIGFEGKVSVEYDKNGVKVTGGGTLTF